MIALIYFQLSIMSRKIDMYQNYVFNNNNNKYVLLYIFNIIITKHLFMQI